MKDGNVIEVRDVYKKYKNYFDKSNTLKERIIHTSRNKYKEYWVLKGINFEVKKGEAIGLVGKNGCGKSTTLKLLTKIIYPDRGSIEIEGRVSSLLELGAGFHPDLSGYENIYLNAAVFGLTRKEIDRRVDEIIDFSELREFINNPIRTYSSGMYMKLAFSVAINVNAEILLIDEILGVGDVNFQAKCFEKLLEIKENGTTIVIVSHATGQIEKICDRSLWVEDGIIKMEGEPKKVHDCYLNIMEERRVQQKETEIEERKERERLKAAYGEEKERIQREIEARVQERKKTRERFEEIERRRRERDKFRQEIEKNKNIEAGKNNETELKIKTDKQILTLSESKTEFERQQELIKKAEEEVKKQQELIALAEQERQRQEKIIRENTSREQFYEKENQRLEHVVKEKDIEIERLNSYIRNQELEIERINLCIQDKNAEISRFNDIILKKDYEADRLNTVILEKDDEADRLNAVILEMDDEIARLNTGILEKDGEINRLNAAILDKDDEIDRLNRIMTVIE